MIVYSDCVILSMIFFSKSMFGNEVIFGYPILSFMCWFRAFMRGMSYPWFVKVFCHTQMPTNTSCLENTVAFFKNEKNDFLFFSTVTLCNSWTCVLPTTKVNQKTGPPDKKNTEKGSRMWEQALLITLLIKLAVVEFNYDSDEAQAIVVMRDISSHKSATTPVQCVA